MEGQPDIRVIDRFLENLAINLEAGGSDRFGLSHYSADRPLKGYAVYRALDSHEKANLPFRGGLTGFLRKPYV